jgi:MFS family permease
MKASRCQILVNIPRVARVVLAGDTLSAIGSGMTLPFLLIYLDKMRGLNTETAALAVTALAAAGLIGNPLGGWLADFINPRIVLVLGLLVSAAGAAGLAGVHSVWHAFAATGLVGLGAAIIWPAQDTLLSAVVDPAHRSTIFAVRHATMNFGLAVGAAIAGTLARMSSLASFQLLYLLDAMTFLAFVPVLLFAPTVRSFTASQIRNQTPLLAPKRYSLRGRWKDQTRSPGFKQVLLDKPFLRLWLVIFLIVAAGAAQLHTAFPYYVTEIGCLGAGSLAGLYAVNACAVVLLQLPVLQIMRGRRRTRGLALVCICWAAAWTLSLMGGQFSSPTATIVFFTSAIIIFAFGETFLSPSAAPLVNDLAPDHLRGRYNGLYVLAWTMGTICGPALTGIMLAKHQATALFSVCILLLLLGAGVTRRVERLAPASSNTIPASVKFQ